MTADDGAGDLFWESMIECGAVSLEEVRAAGHGITLSSSQWKWCNGDLNQYYNNFEKDIKRNSKDVNSYVIHRWLGKDRLMKE